MASIAASEFSRTDADLRLIRTGSLESGLSILDSDRKLRCFAAQRLVATEPVCGLVSVCFNVFDCCIARITP
jgi:hypothetical protein